MEVSITQVEYKGATKLIQDAIDGIRIQDGGDDASLSNLPEASDLLDQILDLLGISS